MKKILPLFTLVSASAIAAACSSSNAPSTGTGPTTTSTAALHDGSTYIAQSLADVANVQADRIVFPLSVYTQVRGYTAGNILVSNRASSKAGLAGNPNGFLRKVVSISKDSAGITVMTTPALLQEAFDTLKFQSTIQLPKLGATGPGAAVGTNAVEGLHALGTSASGSTDIKLLDYSGKVLLPATAENFTLSDGSTIGITPHATVTTGTLDFSPSYDIGVDLGFLTVNGFHATATGTLTADLVLDAGVTLDTTLTGDKLTALIAQAITKSTSAQLANYNVSLGSISAGPISLPTSAQFTAILACQFAFGGGPDVTIGGTATGTVSAGLTYANSTLTPTFSHSLTFTHTGPKYEAGGIVQAFCAVTPKLELQLFGVATADLDANAYAGAGGDLTCGGKEVGDSGVFKSEAGTAEGEVNGQLIAGVSATIDAQVNILGLFKYSKSCVLFNEYENKSYSDTFALPGGASATCSSTQKYEPLPLPSVDGTSCFGSDSPSDSGTPPATGTDAGITSKGDSGTPTGSKDSGSTTNKDGGSTAKDGGQSTLDAGGDGAIKDISDAAFDGSFDATDDGPVVKTEAGIIEGSCTHDVCTAGDRLGQQCNECTMTICAKDPYCCDTLWGPSCFTDVQTYCGHTCQ